MRSKGYIKDLFLTIRWYLAMGGCVLLFFLAFFFPALHPVAPLVTLAVLVLTFGDYAALYFGRGSIHATRQLAPRLSMGDENPVVLSIDNLFRFRIRLQVIDELPGQFQERHFRRTAGIAPRGHTEIRYTLRPVSRGTYAFGRVLCYATTVLGFVERRFSTGQPEEVKVYPSYLQLRRYQLMAMSEHLVYGAKKVRRLGHSMEFEKIKDYVQGDDIRTINWKASARRGDIMVNTFTDARQQLVYCFLDKGRAMQMPFEGMTLLDYSINAALAVLNIALLRQDKAGLITFAQQISDVIPAERRSGQINVLLEALYRQQTEFRETDYESLLASTHRRLTQRSFVLLFTNFESYASLERQLPYLRRLSGRHLLCVVFFQNTLLQEIRDTQPDTVEGIYIKTIAERFDFEKRQIVKELRRHGILSILTTPQQLTVDVINRYLELKARHLI